MKFIRAKNKVPSMKVLTLLYLKDGHKIPSIKHGFESLSSLLTMKKDSNNLTHAVIFIFFLNKHAKNKASGCQRLIELSHTKIVVQPQLNTKITIVIIIIVI